MARQIDQAKLAETDRREQLRASTDVDEVTNREEKVRFMLTVLNAHRAS